MLSQMKSFTNDQTIDLPAIHTIRSQNKQVQKLYCDHCGNWHTKQQVCYIVVYYTAFIRIKAGLKNMWTQVNTGISTTTWGVTNSKMLCMDFKIFKDFFVDFTMDFTKISLDFSMINAPKWSIIDFKSILGIFVNNVHWVTSYSNIC